ncbi:MAG: UvrD-helicase domain-containing protein [Patescibacteria group bacterium]|nr:UvrD-helicase domain-containing protein [Patescibacteria group bacterium]
MINLESLNDRQKQAVKAGMGPVLVLAGPGSGKTKTLTYRIAYIIEKKLVHPDNILALTFTNKAAKEMRERVNKLLIRLPGSAERLTMGTFHSVCARILRKEIGRMGYGQDFVIFDTDDQQKILKEICEELRFGKNLPPSLFSALISRGKNLLQLPGDLSLDIDSRMQERVREVYVRYQDALLRQNALDFDDLLMLTVKLFESDAAVLEKYQKLYTYVLVDEYQDTNLAQYQLLRLLAVHRRLFVVGDDAQSIYGFRGSDITNILNFEKDFPECEIIKLEQNYRSTRNILAVAQKVIEMNPEQKPKTLWTENHDGEKISLIQADDEKAEGEYVAKKIVALAGGKKDEPVYEPDESQNPAGLSILDRFLLAKKKYGATMGGFIRQLPQLPKDHDSLKEYCVLYRTHAQSRAIEEALIQSGIPYQIVGGYKFYDRKEIKDMLCFLRLAQNYRDLVSLKRVLNEPPRGLGEKSYQVIRDFILEAGAKEKETDIREFRTIFSEVKLSPKQWQSAQSFFEALEEFNSFPKSSTLPELIKLIIRRMRLEQTLRDGSDKGESRWENLEELLTVAQKFRNLNWPEALTEFLQEVALLSEIDQKNEEKDAVTLMTLHSAKGLEFDTVFFVGLEEGILPHSRSLVEPKDLAEEVRLAYVGLTRARKNLFLIFARSRMSFGSRQLQTPSRILKAMPRERLQFVSGAERIFESDGEDGIVVEEMEF